MDNSVPFHGNTLIRQGHDGRFSIILEADPTQRFPGVKLSARPGSDSARHLREYAGYAQMRAYSYLQGQDVLWHSCPPEFAREIAALGYHSPAKVAYQRLSDQHLQAKVLSKDLELSLKIFRKGDSLRLFPGLMSDDYGSRRPVSPLLFPALIALIQGRLSQDPEECGTLLLFAGVSGGAGTTTLAWSMATKMAAEGQRPVYFVEATERPRLRTLLELPDDQEYGVERYAKFLQQLSERPANKSVAVKDSLENLSNRTIEESIYEHSSGVQIIAQMSERTMPESWCSTATTRMIEYAMKSGAVVIVDAGVVSTRILNRFVAARAEQVVLVAGPGRTSSADIESTSTMLTASTNEYGFGLDSRRLISVFNRVKTSVPHSSLPTLTSVPELAMEGSLGNPDAPTQQSLDAVTSTWMEEMFASGPAAEEGLSGLMAAAPLWCDRSVRIDVHEGEFEPILARKLDTGMQLRLGDDVRTISKILLINGDTRPEVQCNFTDGTPELFGPEETVQARQVPLSAALQPEIENVSEALKLVNDPVLSSHDEQHLERLTRTREIRAFRPLWQALLAAKRNA